MRPKKPIPWRRRTIDRRFNEWRSAKLFVVGNEVASRNTLIANGAALRRRVDGSQR